MRKFMVDYDGGKYRPYNLYRRKYFFLWEWVGDYETLADAEFAIAGFVGFPKYYF